MGALTREIRLGDVFTVQSRVYLTKGLSYFFAPSNFSLSQLCIVIASKRAPSPNTYRDIFMYRRIQVGRNLQRPRRKEIRSRAIECPAAYYGNLGSMLLSHLSLCSTAPRHAFSPQNLTRVYPPSSLPLSEVVFRGGRGSRGRSALDLSIRARTHHTRPFYNYFSR